MTRKIKVEETAPAAELPLDTPKPDEAVTEKPEGGNATEGEQVQETAPPAPAPAAAPAPEAPESVASAQPRAKASVRDLPRLMTRIFGTPLLVDATKLEIILGAIGPRLGLVAAVPKADITPKAIGALFDDSEDDDEDQDEFQNVPYSVTPDGMAVMCVDGTLVYKSSWLGALSGLTGYSDVKASLDAAMADDSVKGILLQVDSYGGEVNGCFDLCDAIFGMRSQKPIYGVAADDSYSAAFGVLAACSKAFVSRTSGIGSIGVVCAHVDQSAADKMDGLKYTYVYSGDRKIDGNPHAPLSTPALEAVQAECDRVRMLFASSVGKYRSMSVDAVLATQAAKYFGENGVAAGLADAVGTPDDALAALRADVAARAPTAHRAAPMSFGAVADAPASPEAALPETPAAPSPKAAPATEATPETAKPAPVAEGDAPEVPVPEPVVDDPPAGHASAQVIDLAGERKRITGEIVSNAAEIVALCTLAGLPEKASELIRAQVSIADARKLLQTLRAHASEARTITGHIEAHAGSQDHQMAAASWRTAFATVAKRNP
jgi:ClpP class serine protease